MIVKGINATGGESYAVESYGKSVTFAFGGAQEVEA